jgi:hypothetical protein
LLALVVVGGVVYTVYPVRQKILAHCWVMKAVLVACIAGVIAAVLATVL